MKRSEMVKLIADFYDNTAEWKSSSKHFADKLLEKMEDSGIAPPFYEKIQNNNGHKIVIPAREWEDE